MSIRITWLGRYRPAVRQSILSVFQRLYKLLAQFNFIVRIKIHDIFGGPDLTSPRRHSVNIVLVGHNRYRRVADSAKPPKPSLMGLVEIIKDTDPVLLLQVILYSTQGSGKIIKAPYGARTGNGFGYDVAFTRRRSRVRITTSPFFCSLLIQVLPQFRDQTSNNIRSLQAGCL